MNSAFYEGRIRHRRFAPITHSFEYNIGLYYLDLDELENLFRKRWLWSLSGPNLGQLKRTDYMAPHGISLKQAVLQKITDHQGVLPVNSRVCMLTNLRLWGFCFNPVTFYYVFEAGAQPEDDQLHTIVAEVNNTPWNERHTYVLPVSAVAQKKQSFTFSKQLHVSPFNPLDMIYHWSSTTPGKSLLVHMENHREGRCYMDATLTLQRRNWSGIRLNKTLLTGPWRTLWVPLAIYWQALKLWLKRAPVYDHPE